MPLPSIVAFLVAVLVFCGGLLWEWMGRRKRQQNISWLSLADAGKTKTLREKEVDQSTQSPAIEPAWVERLGIHQLLGELGGSLSVRGFLTVSMMCGLTAGLLVIALRLHPVLVVLFALGAAAAPLLVLLMGRRRRERTLVRQLPPAIEMISRALKTGQSIDEAVREVGERLDPPLGGDIRRIYEEISLGLSFQQALRHFESRYKRLTDVRLLCAALIIQRETGGNLTSLLDGLSNTIHERFRLRNQLRALTAEGRLSALILSALPIVFACLAWLIRPEYVSMLIQDPLGRALLSGAIALEIAGFVCMFLLAGGSQ